jgi:hypothetical protein
MLYQRRHQEVAARLDGVVVAAVRARRLHDSTPREGLARFRRPATIELGPGERMIAGRVLYSAAWLNPSPLRGPSRENEHACLERVIVAGDSLGPAGDAGRAPTPRRVSAPTRVA